MLSCSRARWKAPRSTGRPGHRQSSCHTSRLSRYGGQVVMKRTDPLEGEGGRDGSNQVISQSRENLTPNVYVCLRLYSASPISLALTENIFLRRLRYMMSMDDLRAVVPPPPPDSSGLPQSPRPLLNQQSDYQQSTAATEMVDIILLPLAVFCVGNKSRRTARSHQCLNPHRSVRRSL